MWYTALEKESQRNKSKLQYYSRPIVIQNIGLS